MKRLLLKKLIVVSDGEQASKEVNFTDGLNLIIGENKTGKSSIIKSIFYAFGCEVKLESDWKKLIDKYLIYFCYGKKDYCILRKGKNFKICSVNDKGAHTLMFESDHFHEYSKALMDILGVIVDCTTKNGDKISITPPLLFRFQYIDQDKGWNKIADSFEKLGYIKDWKGNSIKYVVGYQNEEFYRVKQSISLVNRDIEKLNIKYSHYSEFVDNIKNMVCSNKADHGYENILKPDNERVKEFLNELDIIQKNGLLLEEKLSKLRNEKYEKFIEIESLKKYIDNLNRDHEFAINQDETLICPFCGTEHKNSINEHIEIVKDVQSGSEQVKLYRQAIKGIEDEVLKLEMEKKTLANRHSILKKKMESINESASILNTYKHEGRIEIINVSIKESDEVKKQLQDKTVDKLNYESKLKDLKSKDRRKQISSGLKEIYTKALEDVNVPTTYIKFKDFVQVIDKTGSEVPRIILAYHTALYLYNLGRGENLFNWLVIDTPNQQGQDGKNLKSIDSILKYYVSGDGQVIVGSERNTGYEGQAKSVILLDKHKRCLKPEDYILHKELLEGIM